MLLIMDLPVWHWMCMLKQDQFYNFFYFALCADSGIAGGGQRGNCPLAETLPPSPPHEITLCTEVYGEPQFWVPVSPPAHPWAPLAAPSFWKVWLHLWLLVNHSTEKLQNGFACKSMFELLSWKLINKTHLYFWLMIGKQYGN